jgi:hypothetical protein
MTYTPGGGYYPSPTETWQCNQCGTQLIGVRLPERRLLPRRKPGASIGYDIQSKCPGCGTVLCGRCMEFQKTNPIVPDSEVRCPECGRKFGAGPILVPQSWAEEHDTAGVGLHAMSYVKDLKTWGKWLVFWTVINFLGWAAMIAAPEAGEESMSALPGFLIMVALIFDVAVFVAAVACLASRTPWSGYYILFAVYLLMIGIFNVFSGGGFWVGLGVVQIICAITVMGKASKYSMARTDIGGY